MRLSRVTLWRTAVLAAGLCVGLASVAMLARPAAATIIAGTPATGLANPDVVIDFEQGALAVATTVTNQFTGVTFGPTYVLSDAGSMLVDNLTGRFLFNDVVENSNSSPGNILFDAPVSAAGFHLRTNQGTTTFEAYLMGTLVESFSAATFFTNNPSSDNFYGFQNIVFDEIRYSIAAADNSMNLDNLQFVTAIPEPGTLALFGLGLAGLGLLARRRRTA